MSFELYSRTVRIGRPELAPGCGYRDIQIHEMTESEIEYIKTSRWLYAVIALAVGFVGGAVVTILTGPYPKF